MATNTIPTTGQTRMDFQASTTLDGLLKNVYIPALNNVTFHATPLMEMFGDFGGTIDFAGNKIIKAFKTQGAGGFGGIAEGGDWVASRNQKGFQGFERIKYLNAYVSLTGPAARTVRQGEAGYVDALSSAMDDTLKHARMQMERIIGGRGNGVLCEATITDADLVASTPNSCTGVAGTYGGYTPVQWLQDGMVVDVQRTIGTDTTIKEAVISSVDYATGTFVITPKSGSTTLTLSAKSTIYLVLANAYGQREVDGVLEQGNSTETGCLEPNGLANLVDDQTQIWGHARSSYPWALKSKVVAAGSAELDEELMMGWILDMVNIQQSVPNVCVVDPKSRLKYFSNRKEDRRFDMPVIDTPFGFRSTGVVIDQYTLMLQSLSSLTPGTLYMLNTNAFKFAKATNGFEWVTDGLGGVFRQKEGSDNLYASAINYMNFVCEDPKGQMKVTGLSY